MTIIGDRFAAPYIRRDGAELAALLPPEIELVTVTHGGSTYSAYLWINGERVGESHQSLTVRGAIEKAAYAYGQREAIGA